MEIKAYVFVLLLATNPYSKDFDTHEQCLKYGSRMTKLMLSAGEKNFLYICETREEYLANPHWARIDRDS